MSSTEGPFSELDDRDPLSRVYKRGYQLRFRRKVRLAASSMLALAAIASLGVMPLAKIGPFRPGPDRVVVASPSESPSPSQSVNIGTPLVIQRSAEPTSSPTSSCHNSFDPSCGAFSWATPPGSNAPTKVALTFTPPDPTVGQRVTLTVTVSDADAPYVDAYLASNWGDGCGVNIGSPLKLSPRKPHGPWTPPAERRGNRRFTFTHTFCKAGDFKVTVEASSNSGAPWNEQCDCAGLDPYDGRTFGSINITVAPSPTSSPTPTPSPTGTG